MIDLFTRTKIQTLRSKGMTYREISESIGLAIPKGTLSYICKGIAMPDSYAARINAETKDRLASVRPMALEANLRKQHDRFEGIKKKAHYVVDNLNKNVNMHKLVLAMLYKAEGSKYKSYRGLALGSSEPSILQTYIRLLEQCYAKVPTDFKARIQHRADQDPVDLLDYWSKELRMDKALFYKSGYDKRTVGKPTTRNDYKGVCVISCSGTDIQLELDAIARYHNNNIWGIGAVG